jgi:hypothetical protein
MMPITWAAVFLGLVSPPNLVASMAQTYGLDPVLCQCIVKQESGWNVRAVNGEYHGLWQWGLESFRETRKEMGRADWAEDLRFDAWESTDAALWAIAHGHLSWWAAAEPCKEVR